MKIENNQYKNRYLTVLSVTQYSARPPIEVGSTPITRSPFFTFDTSEPKATTLPEISEP